MAESEEELKNLLMRVKEESAKNGKDPDASNGTVFQFQFVFMATAVINSTFASIDFATFCTCFCLILPAV